MKREREIYIDCLFHIIVVLLKAIYRHRITVLQLLLSGAVANKSRHSSLTWKFTEKGMLILTGILKLKFNPIEELN